MPRRVRRINSPSTGIPCDPRGYKRGRGVHQCRTFYARRLRGRVAAAVDRCATGGGHPYAFRYHGRPYDFGFDFSDESKLVCSELLYYSFGDKLKFDLEPVLEKAW